MESTTTTPSMWEERCHRLENQVSALKHVSTLRKSLLELRERQVKDLISKLKFYEIIVGEERESRHNLSGRLESAELQTNQLTERLAQNVSTIDEMKANYENKVSTLINELQISEQRNQQLSDQLNCAQLRITEVTKDISLGEISKKLEEKERFAQELQLQMKRIWEKNKALSYQMSLLNNLFTETEGVTIDFEKIKAIGDIVRESQAFSGESEDEVMSDDPGSGHPLDFENLLDSIEKSENVLPADIPGEESCYKSVDTKRGPQLVLSVSRTFIKLKDLIVEKKSLQKEIETLKTLNTKLESKVDKQEHRLYRVTMELNKTWSLVSKLKQQHKRLYNSEAVLRYELQEKRALLDKLKNELSASREKWRRVRQKNSQSQIEWEKLRDEFAQRKHQSSQESGTFSEVMSVSSSGENDATTPLEEEVEQVKVRSRRGSHHLKPVSPASALRPPSDDFGDDDDEEEEGPEEDEYDEGGARALSPMEDDHYEDPLEVLVSNLVEEIIHHENEADTEEESAIVNREEAEEAPPPPTGNESSPSPDFEEAAAAVLNGQSDSQVNDDATSTASTDAAYVSGTENNSVREETLDAKNHPYLDTPTTSNSSGSSGQNATSFASSSSSFPPPSSPSVGFECSSNENNESSSSIERDKLIGRTTSSTENSNINAPLPTTSENNDGDSNSKIKEDASPRSQESQGHLLTLAQPNPSSSSSSTSSQPPSVEEKAIECAQSECPESASSSSCVPEAQPSDARVDDGSPVVCTVVNEDVANRLGNSSSDIAPTTTNNNSREVPCSNMVQVEQSTEPASPSSSSSPLTAIISSASPPPVEALPIQETIPVQHFPDATDEEVNEFAHVQIRPEFLRILQEADEATNSLDWMPSLLTITHSVALLRLEPEVPSGQAETTNDPTSSLRIEIPQQTPSPPNRHHENHHGRRETVSDINGNSSVPRPPQVENEGNQTEEAEERLPAYAKDPSFLSRMIIKQLPKRLQLLKNENHTLQMETAEAKMRMKDMKRQLAKEVDKQQQLTLSLDAQIEEKNLIEFELREEIEKKEKVIEELQMEIDESKGYVNELKKEKEDIDATLQAFMQEKLDMEQSKVPLDSVKECFNCKRPFSFLTRRKFHCKICGKVFCKDCAILREPNRRSSKRPRLCTRCHYRRQRLVSLVKSAKKTDLPSDAEEK